MTRSGKNISFPCEACGAKDYVLGQQAERIVWNPNGVPICSRPTSTASRDYWTRVKD